MATRLRKHLANHKGFTGKQADWKVVYIEEHANKKEAMPLESKLRVGKVEPQLNCLFDQLNRPLRYDRGGFRFEFPIASGQALTGSQSEFRNSLFYFRPYA